MKKDFVIGQSNELIQNGKIYDIHNHYDVFDIAFVSKKNLEITFIPNAVHGKNSPAIKLEFVGIDYLELRLNYENESVSDLDEMGYKQCTDQNIEWLLTEEQATDKDHMFFRLGGENFIRVHSTQAILCRL